MNKEVAKAINKKNKLNDRYRKQYEKNSKKRESKWRNWLRKNRHIIFRVIFFPIWIAIIYANMLDRFLDSRTLWCEERANKILQNFVLDVAIWKRENQTLYLADFYYDWRFEWVKYHIKKKDYRFYRLYEDRMRLYLIESFMLDGFTKVVRNCENNCVEILFKIKQEEEGEE